MRRGWSVGGGGNGSNIYVIVIALGDMSIARNPFNSTDQKKCFANNVDPDELARTNRLIKIYTVCLFFYLVTALFAILFSISVYEVTLTEIMDTINFIDGRVHFVNKGERLIPFLHDTAHT